MSPDEAEKLLRDEVAFAERLRPGHQARCGEAADLAALPPYPGGHLPVVERRVHGIRQIGSTGIGLAVGSHAGGPGVDVARGFGHP